MRVPWLLGHIGWLIRDTRGVAPKLELETKRYFGSNAYGTKISLISGNGALLSSWGMVV